MREYPHIFGQLTVFLWTMIVVFIVHFLVVRLFWWHYPLLGLLVGLTFNFGEYFGEIKYLWKEKKRGEK